MAGRSLLLTCDVSAEQEEPWRRLLQELSDGGRREEYVRSRRRLGIWAESVWFVPKPPGGGVTVAYLEASDPKRALRELAASEASFETYYSRVMGKRSGLDVVRLGRAATGELLFAWHDAAAVWGEREAPNDSCPDAHLAKDGRSVEHIEKGETFGSETYERGDRR